MTLLLHIEERGFVVITVRLRGATVASEAACNDDDHTFAISFAQIPYS